MDLNVIEMAALGRSLYPGMLYDCRKDSFIPGVTLWDKASLTQDLDVRRQPYTDLKFSASDSLSDKAILLDVSASLKASFLGGLVEVGGSAKYLNDQKSSTRQSRVTLQYSQKVRFEQLTMTQLGKFTYPQVFDEKTATHVVTAVLYGSQVFMVFDRTNAENENKQEIEGNVHALVKKISSFSIEGQGALKMNEKEKELAESISCTFYGDCVLEENPTTYIEALQLYKKLPSLLKQTENDAVPVKVWLHPLAQLDSRAAKLEREISATLISKVENVLEDLGDAERRVKDILKNRTVNAFQDVKNRLKAFQDLFNDYKVLFQKALGRLLSAVRGGQINMQALTDILLIHQRSLFRKNKVIQWLENVQGELNLLNSYTRELSGVPIITSLGLDKILFDPIVDTVVCFSFTSLQNEDPYLSTITEFLRVDEFEKLTVSNSSDQDIQAWYRDPKISEMMRSNIFLFRSFFEANKESENIRFVVASVSDSSNPGTSICLYRNGKMVDSKFLPVSKPPAPSVDIQDVNVILRLQKSPTGVTVRYRVEYRVKQPEDSEADGDEWEFTDTPDAQETFTLTALQQANQYEVRCRALSDVGLSEASESVVFFLPEQNETAASFSIELRNRILSNLGTSQWSLSTIQSQHTNRVSSFDIPYEGAVPEGLKPGMALFFRGHIFEDGNAFTINLKTGSRDGEDIAFQYKFHFETHNVVCNSFKGGLWGKAEETRNVPFRKEKGFHIFMVIHPESYEIIVNGQVVSRFKHRIPLERVSVLNITGHLSVDIFSIIEVENIVMKVTIPPLNVTTDLFY
ncbi:cytolytic toxin-alpha-like [Salminus brasiliensis]|uniref:cytolytic toxin-alpha-like n=1 Tax=Salminus brasiliensis TaxID=930266 RepID=UPI003B830F6C